MSIPATLEDPAALPPGTGLESSDGPHVGLADRMHRLEGEVAELRHTLSGLAEIVVGDIRDRREAAATVFPSLPEVSIPASLVPGGEAALKAVSAVRRPWLLFDLMREIGATVKMYMDPRYRVRRSTQLMVPLILALLVGTYLFFNLFFVQIPVLSPVLERAIDFLLAVLLYKVLMREVARYRQMVAGLAVGGRPRLVPASLLNNDPDTAAVTRLETH
jgi:hypothetical protein